MNTGKKKAGTLDLRKTASVFLMMFCLTFLTSMNFFVYSLVKESPVSQTAATDCDENGNDYPPSGPTEEKAGNSGISVSEEILHESHPELNFQASNQSYLHHIAESAKIEMFHPELVLPPPKA